MQCKCCYNSYFISLRGEWPGKKSVYICVAQDSPASFQFCVCWYMCVDRGQPWVLFLRWLSDLCVETQLFTVIWDLSIRLKWLAIEPQQPLSISSELGLQMYATMTWFLSGFWGSNPGLYACLANTFKTDLSSQALFSTTFEMLLVESLDAEPMGMGGRCYM